MAKNLMAKQGILSAKSVTDLPYCVKILVKGAEKPWDKWQYGTISQYGKDSKQEFDDGNIIFREALTGIETLLPISDLKGSDVAFMEVSSSWNKDDEYNRYIETELKNAMDVSDAAGEGLQKGKLFSLGVADGSAWYVVTKVNKKTVHIEWRGFCPDNYFDQVLSGGGKFENHVIEKFMRGKYSDMAQMFPSISPMDA